MSSTTILPDPATNHLTSEQWKTLLDEWVSRLDRNLPDDHQPLEIDVMFGAGGFRGFYFCGLMHYFLFGRRFRVVHTAGASAGAAAAVGIMCNIDIPSYITTYHQQFQPQILQNGKSIIDVFSDAMKVLLPSDVHKLCEGRVHISVSEVRPLHEGGLHHYAIDHFPTRENLEQVVCCSMAIPKATMHGSSQRMGDRQFLDGVFPVFPHAATRPRLMINLQRVQYPPEWIVLPLDDNIGRLILQGMKDLEYFLATEDACHLRHRVTMSRNLNEPRTPTTMDHTDSTLSPATTDTTLPRHDLSGASPNNDDENKLPLYWVHHPRDQPSANERRCQRYHRLQQGLLHGLHIGSTFWDRMQQTRTRAREQGLVVALFGNHLG